MTEAEWLAATDPRDMFPALQDVAYDRKFRLFAVEAIRPLAITAGDACTLRVLDVATQAAEGSLNHRALREERRGVGDYPGRLLASPTSDDITRAAGLCLDHVPLRAADRVIPAVVHLAGLLYHRPTTTTVDEPSEIDRLLHALGYLAGCVRDIFGNPFRPVGMSRAWQTSTSLALARQMYESRDFSPMPILADALQDAGCEQPDILAHCRGEGPHVRGCWVVDLVLGKS